MTLELKKSGKTAENFLGKVTKSLGEKAHGRAKKQKIVIQYKGIEEIKKKKDIREALEKQFEQLGLQDSAVSKLSKTHKGQLYAYQRNQRSNCSESRCPSSATFGALNLAT